MRSICHLRWRSLRIVMRRRRRRRRRGRGSKKQATTAANTARLPQDILASILVRLPGNDLRRLRRVCKEWRDIISDPAFIQAHLIHGSRTPPTHTIVFFPGFTYGSLLDPGPGNARGFLFDEHWRLTAEFTAGVWDMMIGACDGLLCFLEAGQGSIKIVEPSTGESLALPLPLPLPPEASGPRWAVNPAAYCFGYDATTRRYKIVHHNFLKYTGEAIDDQELHVYTVGGGHGWTRLHVAFSVYGRAFADPAYVDGSVYWPTCGHGERGRDEKLARFHLATEKITSEAFLCLQLKAPRPESALFCRLVDSTTSSCVMTYERLCERHEWNVWFPHAEAQEVGLPAGAHVLLRDHGLYLRRVERSLEFGQRELLFDTGKEQPRGRGYKYNGSTSFVPVPAHRRLKHLPIAGAPPLGEQCQARAFGYSPTVSAAPLALYLGTPSPLERKSAAA